MIGDFRVSESTHLQLDPYGIGLGDKTLQISTKVDITLLKTLAPSHLSRDNYRYITLADPVVLANDAQLAVHFIRFLRECMTYALSLTWTAASLPECDLQTLFHLNLPAVDSHSDPEATTALSVDQWRAEHRYPLCYYRVGPGFVTISKLRRRSSEPATFQLEGSPALELFTRFHDVVFLPQATPPELALFDALFAEKLVVEIGGWATLLPHRLLEWPVTTLESE